MIKILSSALIALVLLSGCGAKHIGIKKDRALILSEKTSDSLYEYIDENIEAQAPKSGFYPLENELDSLSARILLAKSAKHHIAIQYFVFHSNSTGLILTKALIDAANRGVKVDVLIDDMAISYNDKEIALINSHKNITVRVFNPTNSRRALHYVEMGLYSDTVGRRMHNKSFVADNSIAIFGGRNIGDHYFGTSKDGFFVDNDVLAVGPIVNDITNQFRRYFSNSLSVDFKFIGEVEATEKEELKKLLTEVQNKKTYKLLKEALLQSQFYSYFTSKTLPLYFGDSELLYDMPQKVVTNIEDTQYHLKSKIPKKITATKNFYITNPYFIPSEKMMQRLQALRNRGVDIALLTNSLESTDTISVYAYYSQVQKQLLEMGVRLYETHPQAFEDEVLNQKYNLFKKMPRAALHAKTIVIDDDIFAIGSVNMDPRSRNLNTELVGLIKSKELNAYEKNVFEIMTEPRNAYELRLEYDENNESKITWTGIRDGKKQTFYHDGDASLWMRIKKTMTTWFPVRDLL